MANGKFYIERLLGFMGVLIFFFLWYLLSVPAVAPVDSIAVSPSQQVSSPVPSSQELDIPPGWVGYYNSDWGFRMAYPSVWTVQEMKVNNKLNQIKFAGRTNTIIINQDFGMGLPSDQQYVRAEYTVAGQVVRAVVWPGGGPVVLTVKNGKHYLTFRITGNTENKPLTDLMLSTVILNNQQ